MVNTSRFTWTIPVLIFCFSCGDNKPAKQENEITRIVFATGGCFGPCPIQVFDIDSSLKVKYNGIENTDFKGFHRGKVTQEFWDSLNIKFESINYKELDSAYNETVDDLSTELMIYDKDKIKYIQGQSSSLPNNVRDVYDWLLRRVDMMELTKTTDSLIFPTYLDRPPLRTTIKFVAPKADLSK